jgi:hypothetical protein
MLVDAVIVNIERDGAIDPEVTNQDDRRASRQGDCAAPQQRLIVGVAHLQARKWMLEVDFVEAAFLPWNAIVVNQIQFPA